MEDSKFVLTEENYYSVEANEAYCSASQYKSFIGYPFAPACEHRAMAELRGEWKQETTKALLIGSILDELWSGATAESLAIKFPDCISSRGSTKGMLKAEFSQSFQLYQRTIKDEKFRQFMSGEKQKIFTGVIEGLPFKIKIDSFIDGVCITDLKTTQDCSEDYRYFVPDSGERLPFYYYMAYDVQLAIYQEITRQNTGKKLPCYIAAVDKKSHPMPRIIQMEQNKLDEALENVKRNANKIIMLKNGDIKPAVRCEKCDYCRDTYECKVMSASEFETHDIGKNDI